MNKKVFTALIATAMLASMGTGAFAATKLQEIKAYLNPDLRIQVDGTVKDLINASGQKVSPII